MIILFSFQSLNTITLQRFKYHIERNHPADLDNLDTTLHSPGEEKTEMGEVTMFNDMQVFRGDIDRPSIS